MFAAVEFSMWELHLFLDTHPDCEEAVEHRLRLMAERLSFTFRSLSTSSRNSMPMKPRIMATMLLGSGM